MAFQRIYARAGINGLLECRLRLPSVIIRQFKVWVEIGLGRGRDIVWKRAIIVSEKLNKGYADLPQIPRTFCVLALCLHLGGGREDEGCQDG